MITNQAGIGRGKFTLKDFLDVSEFMIQEFEARHIYLTAIYFVLILHMVWDIT